MGTDKFGAEAAHSSHSGGRPYGNEYLSNRENPLLTTIKKPMYTSSRQSAMTASPPA